jgi:hypothetical protein
MELTFLLQVRSTHPAVPKQVLIAIMLVVAVRLVRILVGAVR